MAHRLEAMGKKKYANGFNVTCHVYALAEPLYNPKPSLYFVCSMADLFHELVPDYFIDEVMRTIENSPKHTFQILTKRARRMHKYFEYNSIPKNVWLGVTVEKRSELFRVEFLSELKAPIRFLSCEPLLGRLDLDLENIDWVIVGGESGPHARPMKPEWVKSIWEQAYAQRIPFFFKQWGTYGPDGVKRSKQANGKELDGRIVQQMPNWDDAP